MRPVTSCNECNTDRELGVLVAELSRPQGVGVALAQTVERGRAGRAVARLMRLPTRVPALTTRITRLHAWLLRMAGGQLRRSWMFAAGQPVMALTTTGRRSGASRTTAVAALTSDGRLATVGMNLGSTRTPAWAHNLRADPDAWIAVAGRTIPVRAREATGTEREALWRRWLEVQPSAAVFAELAEREIVIFVLEARAR